MHRLLAACALLVLPSFAELQFPSVPVTVHFVTINSDQAYKIIGKLSSIQIVIDPSYQPQKITLDLTDSFPNVLNAVSLKTNSTWRGIDDHTIYVTAK